MLSFAYKVENEFNLLFMISIIHDFFKILLLFSLTVWDKLNSFSKLHKVISYIRHQDIHV